MNYLQLAQRLRQECGIAGSGPLTVVGQNNEAKRLVDWTNEAWLEIQGLHDNWNFMRQQFSFETAPNVGDYTVDGGPGVGAGLTDFRYWHRDTLRCYKTADGIADEQWLVEWEYQTFRNTYRYAEQTNGRPVVFAVKPQGSELMFGSIPDDFYTIDGEYQSTPQPLVADTDVPNIPVHLHIIIVYKAMEFYGLFESAGEVLARAQRGYRQYLTMLEREKLPTPYLGDPLA
jgi:hypothetical protein